ncbi:MAG: nucleoside triphosphate pyrophosphohydrolase family protein [Acetobacteraceae bacterium]|nr:nucleoside triphosphate pyrophosphohydrolase family protein [Acetobacteraceae bacterium]
MTATPPLTFREYQARAVQTDRTRAVDAGLVLPLLGLFGETGSLLSEAKKKHRDAASYLGYEGSVVEELGDVLWYLTVLADRAHIELSDIAASVSRDFRSWADARDPDLSFAALGGSPLNCAAHAAPTPAYDRTLLKLAGQVGLLLTRFNAGEHADNRDALSGDLVAVLRLLVQAADEAGVALEGAARQNLAKIADRWPAPDERVAPPPFDESFPSEEQIPRRLEIEVFERLVGGKLYVFQRCNGINMGDRLTDNIMTPDDYRFHDVFHYAYAAVLGWSPVLRALFRLKPKSRPEVDESEDGARAGLIEEGLATWIFGHAKRIALFEGIAPGELPLDLLKGVRDFVAGYEAEACPLWLWEEAILQSYVVFRHLKQERRGLLRLDLVQRRLSIDALPA